MGDSNSDTSSVDGPPSILGSENGDRLADAADAVAGWCEEPAKFAVLIRGTHHSGLT